MDTPSIAVVVANQHPHLEFLDAWAELHSLSVAVIVMQDAGGRADLVDYPIPSVCRVFDHAAAEEELGDSAWIIPRRSSACRSYGIWQAYKTGAPIIACLDNDCYPDQGLTLTGHQGSDYWIADHRRNLEQKVTLDWTPSTGALPTRGFPYLVRGSSDVWLSHGLWSGRPDLDAIQELGQLPDVFHATRVWRDATLTIPRWSFFPMCSMNLAWRRELTPAMWHGLFGPEYGFDQYDDIWCGVLAKKILDVLGKAAVSGSPSVEHRRQSGPFLNLRKQAPGLEVNEHFWRAVQNVMMWQQDDGSEPTAQAVAAIYRSLIASLPDTLPGDEALDAGYLARFKEGADVWAQLFQ